MDKLQRWIGSLPLGNWIDYAVIAAVLLAIVLLTGCASTQEAPLGPADARVAQAQALQKIGENAKDGETQRLAIFALMNLDKGAPQPIQVAQPRSVGEAVVGFLDRTLERTLGIVPSFLAYKGQVRAAQTTETVASINRDVSVNQSNNFLALGLGGINGTAQVGTAGVNALASVAVRPQTPTTAITITGNSGPVNTGTGTLTNNSNNPVNPAPKVCATATGTVNCN